MDITAEQLGAHVAGGSRATTAGSQTADSQTADSQIAAAQILDVREDAEVAEGRIPGALHIALGELPGRLAELDKSLPVIAVCRSGRRSAAAVDILSGAGFTAHNLTGGMLDWTAAGLPTD